jgi:glucokinase
MARYIGFDIGGTKCAVSLGNERAEVLDSVRFPTEAPETTVPRLLEEAKRLAAASDEPVRAAGISCGSPLDPARGVIQSPPNLPGWDGVEIVRMTKERLGVPAVLCNDANACALAEWKFGAGRGCRNMIFLTFGTGMGAGMILDGKPYGGANGNAGEVGHIRLDRFGPVGYGKQGSFEGFASGGGIAMAAKTAAIEKLQRGQTVGYCRSYDELGAVTAKSVAQAARAGDGTARAVYRQAGEMLGRGLSVLVDILNPERIVIGSIFQRCADLLREPMERVMKEECLPFSLAACEVVPAQLGDDVGDRAALALAISLDTD